MGIRLNDFISISLALPCEDVREEVGKKISIMGAFTSDILVAEFPATIRIAFLAALNCERPGEYDVGIKLLVNGELIADAKSKVVFAKGIVSANTVIPVGFLRIEKEGEISMQMSVIDGEWVEALNRKVSLGTTA